MMPKKVLIVSHDPFSRITNNGKTLASLFSDWPAGRIAQLFFQAEEPDFSVCRDFFRLTDADMVRRLLGRDAEGTVLHPGRLEGKPVRPPRVHRFIRKHKWPVFIFLRGALWKVAGGRTPLLKNWLDAQAPEVLLLTASESTFSYGLALWISRRYRIPLILYCLDDYVTPRLRFDPFWWIELALVRRLFRKAVTGAGVALVIGRDMAREYRARFGVPCVPIMHCLEVGPPKAPPAGRTPLRLAYIGALHLGRWKVLALIGRALAALGGRNPRATLSIYCAQPPGPKVLQELSLAPFMAFCGALDTEGVRNALADADILVHVESFKRSFREYTRLSVSTKIPEYLASGKCIFAVGPPEVASLRYLESTGGAELVTEAKLNTIKEAVARLVDDEGRRLEMGRRAYEAAQRNHDEGTVRRILTEVLNASPPPPGRGGTGCRRPR